MNNLARLIYFIVVIIALIGCTSKTGKVQIKGKINSSQPVVLYFKELAVGSLVSLDSIKTNPDGTFNVDITPSEFPAFVIVESPSMKGRVTLVVNDGELIETEFNVNNFPFDYSVKGSLFSNEIKQTQDRISKFVVEADSIYMAFRYAADTANFVQRRSVTDSLLKRNYLETYNFLKDFIKGHPSSFASLLNLHSEYSGKKILDFDLDFDIFKLVADSCGVVFPKNSHLADLKSRVDEHLAKLENAKKVESTLQKGNFAPNFSLPDIKGKWMNLSDLKGRKVILHFWSYSQKPSWDINAELKEIYKTRDAAKLEIIGVNLDDDKIAWANTVALDKLDWINCIADQKVIALYNLGKTSKVIIVDEQGRIILNSIDIEQIKNVFRQK